MSCLWRLLLIVSSVYIVVVNSDSNGGNGGMGAQTPAMTPDEMFQDMFPLTIQNYTDKLLRNRDPWIVLFHDGELEKEWKTMAVHLRGLVWMGLVDTRHDSELLVEMQYDLSRDTGARVYPYGDRRKKIRTWESVKTPNEARSMATSFLPDKTSRLKADGLQDFLIDCYSANPSRFPVVYLTDEEETSPLLKALSVRFEKYVSFGRMVKPTPEGLTKVGLSKVFVDTPAIYVYITDEGNVEKFNAIQYDKASFGQMNYTNVMQFLFAINSKFRHTLPGNNMSNEQREAEMSDVLDVERQRFDVNVQDERPSSSNSKKDTDTTKSTKDEGFTLSVESNLPSEKDEL